MKSITFCLSLLSLMFFAQAAQAQHLTKLGERLSICKNLESDDFLIQYNDALRPEVKSLLENNKLQTAIVAADNCFRVGTELKIELLNDDLPFLGRGILEELKVVSKNQLLADPLNTFSSNSTKNFIESTPARKYALLKFKVTEKIQEAYVNEKFKRLPSCFPAFNDWEYSPQSEDSIKDIKAGKTTAFIWNGTSNCYKVGILTELLLEKERREDPPTSYGYIVPTELFLVHYTNLNQKHADLLGERLSQLKKRMAEKKEIDGGWVTMVAFEYQAINPKDLPVEDPEDSETSAN